MPASLLSSRALEASKKLDNTLQRQLIQLPFVMMRLKDQQPECFAWPDELYSNPKQTWVQLLWLPFWSLRKLGQVLKTEPGSEAEGGSEAGVTGKLNAASSPSRPKFLGVPSIRLQPKSMISSQLGEKSYASI